MSAWDSDGELLGVGTWVGDSELLGVGTCDGVTDAVAGVPTTLIPRNWNVDVAIAVATAPAVVPMRYTTVFVPEEAEATQ